MAMEPTTSPIYSWTRMPLGSSTTRAERGGSEAHCYAVQRALHWGLYEIGDEDLRALQKGRRQET